MKPDLSQWQSNATYSYIDHLDVADIAWEWLRRNQEYQNDFARYIRMEGVEAQSAQASSMAERWGVRFPGPSKPDGPYSVRILDARGRHRHPRRRALARPSRFT